MKLLIITQKVDKNDPILGFFHRWLIEFSRRFEKVTIMCLFEGQHKLPDNVKVLSLGKESGENKLKYLWRFYRHSWQERKNYDAVFIHMNEEYVLLGGLLWSIFQKPVFLWRNHAKGSWLTRLAVFLSRKVFYTSPHSFTASFNKARQMPTGIDTDFFAPQGVLREGVLILGRIYPVKKVREMIATASVVAKKMPFTLSLVGDPENKDTEYGRTVERDLASFPGRTIRVRAVTQEKARDFFSTADVVLNFTPEGSFDKAIFEAAACGAIILSTNSGLSGQVPKDCLTSPKEAVLALQKLLKLSPQEKESLRRALREEVIKNHSLLKLADKLEKEIN
ncbi:MAG: glycosyltransferase [bacterium]|nr:glycosyltransferase [bacterium]